MTTEQAKLLYIGAGGPATHTALEWEDIRAEMDAVVKAPTDIKAGRTIQWWGCWDEKLTATAFARRVRRGWRKQVIS